MQDARRQILTEVAAGTLTPTEAANRLEEIERGPASSGGHDGPGVGSSIRGVRVSSSFGRVVVLGDASVDQVTVDGPHAAHQEGDLFVIEGESRFDGDFSFGRRTKGHWWDGIWDQQTVTVRMNPRLEVWVNSDAGTVTVRDIVAPIHAEVQAGSLTVQGFRGPLDLSASAGSIRGEGTLAEGTSRIRCEMGSVRIELAADSDVRVTAMTQVGRLHLDQGSDVAGPGGWSRRQEATYGAGTAALEVESQMGSVVVSGGR